MSEKRTFLAIPTIMLTKKLVATTVVVASSAITAVSTIVSQALHAEGIWPGMSKDKLFTISSPFSLSASGSEK
jgi:hypothetical protein